MKYVISTSSVSTKFIEYHPCVAGGIQTPKRHVIVHGGANIASVKSAYGEMGADDQGIPMWTPQGVVTSITDEQAKFLASHDVFKAGVVGGFYKILDTDPGQDHKKVKALAAADMTARDGSAPLTADTLKSRVKITTVKVAEEQ